MSALCRLREHPGGITDSANASSALAVIVSGSLNKKINTLLIFVSITGTGRFQANAIIAAEVYGPIHDNFCNSILSFGKLRRIVFTPTPFCFLDT